MACHSDNTNPCSISPCAEEERTQQRSSSLKKQLKLQRRSDYHQWFPWQTRLGWLKGLPGSGCLGSEPYSGGRGPTPSSSPKDLSSGQNQWVCSSLFLSAFPRQQSALACNSSTLLPLELMVHTIPPLCNTYPAFTTRLKSLAVF